MTYGVGKDRTRLDIEVKKETGKQYCGCCGDDRTTNKALVHNYE